MIHKINKEITAILTNSHDYHELFVNLVNFIAKTYADIFCSIYLLDAKKTHLNLMASTLPENHFSSQLFLINQNLASFLEQQKEIISQDSKSLDFSADSFPLTINHDLPVIIVPIISHRTTIGIFVIEHQISDPFSQRQIEALMDITNRFTEVINDAGILFFLENYNKNITDQECQTINPHLKKTTQNISLLKGKVASPGIGIGKAVLLNEGISFETINKEYSDNIDNEKIRFQKAFNNSIDQIKLIKNRVEKFLSTEDGAIFHAHLMIIEDRYFYQKIIHEIENGYKAEWALKIVIYHYLSALQQVDDPYLRERLNDIRDIGQRLLGNLLGLHSLEEHLEVKENCIIIADDLNLSQLISLHLDKVQGFVLVEGGITSHFAILAKSYNIPLLVGVGNSLLQVQENSLLILDADHGELHICPSAKIKKHYAELIKQKQSHADKLAYTRALPTATIDGAIISLQSNIGLLNDVQYVHHYGANGVGLYRTEFQFLGRKNLPSEEEQFNVYSNILKDMKGFPTTIRTLDVGGDKFFPSLNIPKEPNPYLGWRSIRICLDTPQVFRTQLRALLRASVYGNLKIMFPLISSLTELRQAKAILKNVHEELVKEGVEVQKNIPVGMMIEVPSAVLIAHKLIQECDFFSIGTNDLIQYTLAVDRNNPKVAHLYEALHPAILLQIKKVIKVATDANKPVSICGEIVSDPIFLILLIGMGIQNLSITPFNIPVLKNYIRKINFQDAQKNLETVMNLDTAAEIKEYMQSQLKLLYSNSSFSS